MRKFPPVNVESRRIRMGQYATTSDDGMNGAFQLLGPLERSLDVIAYCGDGWERVSVSVTDDPLAYPTWEEMHWIKSMFWYDEECVVQFHFPNSHAVIGNGALTLWKIEGRKFPLPPDKITHNTPT